MFGISDATDACVQTTPVALVPSCAICDATVTTHYYRVNGNAVCPSCRRPLMAELVRRHGTTGKAFVRGWLFGALSGVSGYVTFGAATALLEGYDGMLSFLIGPLVWHMTKWANPGCTRTYRVMAVCITYGSIFFSSILNVAQGLIAERVIEGGETTDFWLRLGHTIERLLPLVQHPAGFLVIILIGFGVGEVVRLRQLRASLIQGPFRVVRRS